MDSQILHNIKHRKYHRDNFYTPYQLAKNLIELIPLKPNEFILDPALGLGAFFDNYPSFVKKDFCEIELGKDFFDYNQIVDWCITNPPYSILDKWFSHTLRIAEKGFAYLIGLDNHTAKRVELCNKADFGFTMQHLCKIKKWMGMSIFVVFEKNKPNMKGFTYDRTVWYEDQIVRNERKKRKYKNFSKIDKFINKNKEK